MSLSAFKCHRCPIGKVRSRIRSGTCKDPFSNFEMLYIDVCACLLSPHEEKREQLHCAVAINRVMVCGYRRFYCPVIVSPSCQRKWFVKLLCQWNTNVYVYTLALICILFPLNTWMLMSLKTHPEARLCVLKMVMSSKPLCQQWGFTHDHNVRSLCYRQKALIGPWEVTAEQSTHNSLCI